MISHDPDRKTTHAYVIEGHMDVTNTATGAVRSLAANQQMTAANGTLGPVQPMSRETWENLVSRQGLNAGGGGTPPSGGDAPAGGGRTSPGGAPPRDIPSLNATVAGLRFYESEHGRIKWSRERNQLDE